MKRILAFLALACAPALHAADPQPMAFKWDLTGTSFTYPRYCTSPATAATSAGVETCPGPGVSPVDGNGTTKAATTAGVATTTVTAKNSNSPFLNMAVGDLIIFNNPRIILSTGAVAGPQMRVITTFTNANTIVVDSNITIDDPGVTFRWWRFIQGTTAEDGYIAFPSHGNLTIHALVDTLNATSLDYIVQCRMCINDRCLTPVNITASTNIIVATPIEVSITNKLENQCRIGMKLNTDAGVQSISIAFGAEMRP